MGNKYLKGIIGRTRKDPRTKKRRNIRKKTTPATTNSPDTGNSSTAAAIIATTTNSIGTGNLATTSSVLSPPEKITASERKITAAVAKAKELVADDASDGLPSGYVFMDTEIIFSVFDELLKCPKCRSNVISTHCIEKKMGFSSQV